MTELAVRVLLKADSSGLVGQVRPATAAVRELGAVSVAAGGDAKVLAVGTAAAGGAARKAADDTGVLARELGEARAAMAMLTNETKQAQQATAEMAGRADVLETRLRASNRAHVDGAAAANRQAFGLRNLGQQFGDLGLSIQGGISPARAFGQQAGQIGYALSEMGGRLGTIGRFLTGPWGIFLTIGAAAVAPLIEQLFKSGDAADSAKRATEELAKSVGDIGSYFDRTTGKIIETNKALVQYAVLSRQRRNDELRGQQVAARDAVVDGLRQSVAVRGKAAPGIAVGGAVQFGVSDFAAGSNDVKSAFAGGGDVDARLRSIANSGSTNAGIAAKILEQRASFFKAAHDIQKTDAEIRSLLTGTLDKSLQTGKPPKTGGGATGGTRGSAAGRVADGQAAVLRELEGLARQLKSDFDPAQAAADAYLKTLDDIAKLVKSGDLSPAQGDAYQAGALDRYRGAAAKAQGDSLTRVFADVLPAAGEQLDAIVAKTTAGWARDLDKGAKEAGDTLESGAIGAGQAFRSVIQDIGDLFGQQIGSALGSLVQSRERAEHYEKTLAPQIGGALKSLKIGISDDQAAALGTSIGTKAGKAIAGAQDGQAIAGLASAIGIKLNSTGSQIGGALGSFLPIPGGQIIGSIAGGLIGNLFTKPKYGTAALTGSAAAATSGNGTAAQAAANTLAGSVQSGLATIAQRLGAEIGAYRVSIGTFNGQYRVSTTGFTGSLDSKKAAGQGLVGFGKDGEAAAIAFAISDAIADGAIVGVSAAVAQALRSSTDIDKALTEALKVKDVERLVGGLSGQIKMAFSDFDTSAAERVRIAKQYGLDLVEVERINAEQRADLLNDTLKARVGSLKDLLSNLQYGDLFEGDAATRRKAIMSEIGTVKADAEAGKDGAADRLAELYRTLVSTSKEAFGTAGTEYTADRATAVAGVERVVQIENARIAAASAAQKATTDAVAAGNALLNEGNDLTVSTNDKLDAIYAALTRSGVSPTPDLTSVTRSPVAR